MKRNVTIILLLIICFGLLIYGQYQRTLYKRALHENEVLLEQANMRAEEARKLAEQAMEEAQKQRNLAEAALQEAQK